MSPTATIELSEVQSEIQFEQPTPNQSTNQKKTSPEIVNNTNRNSINEFENLTDVVSILHPTSPPPNPSKLRIALTILQPSLINFFSSFTTGIITVALPTIATSLSIPTSLYLWPSSVYGLTCGALLLIAGSIADLVGSRNVELVGIFLLTSFTLAAALSTSGIQLVVFRALQGIAMAMHLPASVSLVAAGVPQGRARNFGFGCLGMSQPLGFSVGLVASGIMVDRAGWRSAFYLSAAGLFVSSVAAFWILPNVKASREGDGEIEVSVWKKIVRNIDWIGGVLASGGLAMLAYVLAILSADLSAFKHVTTIVLFAISVILLAAFPIWMHSRERSGKPALVPNSLWKNSAFTATCIMVALSYGVANSLELFSSLYFQEIQSKSTLTTSLYLLPNLLVGVMVNISIGLLVHRWPARWIVVLSSLLCAISPLIMALVNPRWNYWYLQFWAQLFAPLSVDVLFTVGLIIVSSNFPQETQALAGAVFNTVGQFGMSFGIGMCQVVALGVMGTEEGGKEHGDGSTGHGGAFSGFSDAAALDGFRAAFWTMFACMITCVLIAVFGLRRTGKVGVKRE